MASMGPSLDLPAPVARPLIAARAASMASSGSDLPWLRRDCRLGRSTSTISMPRAPQGPGQPGAIGARPFDTDLGHLAEALEPGQQGLVAGGIGLEGLDADQAAEGVEGCSDVGVEVGVDATRDPWWSFYEGHRCPYFP